MAIHGAQVSVRFTWDNQQCENVFHVYTDPNTPLDQTTADGIHTVVNTWVKNTLQQHQTGNCLYREIAISDTGNSALEWTYSGDMTGGPTTQSMPNNVTIAVKKNTGFAGRKFRGRFYHVGLDRSDVAGNYLGPSAAVAIQSIYASLMTSLATHGTPLAVAQRDHTVHPAPVIGLTVVTSISLSDTAIDSQRRRLPGRGK